MALEITGKIIQIMPPVTGTSKAGKDWVKQEFVIETVETYPRKVCIGMMGEKTAELKKYVPGNEVKVSINVESREYGGKWYTNVNAWRIDPAGSGQMSSPQEAFVPDPEPGFTPDSSTDDLPF